MRGKEERVPGIRMIEGWLLLWGSVVGVFSIPLGLLQREMMLGLLVSGVTFALLGITLLIDRKTRGIEGHWAQAGPERLRVSHAIWYFFVSVGPVLLAGLIAAMFSGGAGVRLAAAGAAVALVAVFAGFVKLDRMIVMRREAREAKGELPVKKTRLIHAVQAFFVLFGLTGLLLAVLGDDPDMPLAGLLVAGLSFAGYFVCRLIERVVAQRGKFDRKSLSQAAFAYCIPLGILTLGAGIFRLISESAKAVPQNSRMPESSHAGMAFMAAGLFFAFTVGVWLVERIRKRRKKREA